MKEHINIAIDGPAGAGKSTIAKRVAKKLQIIYVDTGAMYRAAAHTAIEEGVDPADLPAVEAMMDRLSVKLEYDEAAQAQRVIANGTDVTPYLRTEAVGNMASKISAYPVVRAKLTALQQEMAKSSSLVMDGRDIGTVVLPEAEVKIFLTASSEARAKRRFLELAEKGEAPDLKKIKADIEERDYRDSHREAAPLKQAKDAVLVDSSDLSIDEVTEMILALVKEKCNV